MRETAYAKVNLALHVRRRRTDGYHDVETVFAFAEEGDQLRVKDSDRLELIASGPFAADLPETEENIVLDAADRLRRHHGVARGARLALDKRLPVASGIGGGSADAAATLRLLTRWWKLPNDLSALTGIAAGIGADVPVCFASRTMIGTGRGDRLRPGSGALSGEPILLVNPRVALSTAAVFADWDGIDHGPLGAWEQGRNDLQPAAVARVPEIADVLAALGTARIARMSGSGATCFGLFPTEQARDQAARAIARAQPDWWILPTRLR